MSSNILIMDGNVNLESLEEINNHEDTNSGSYIIQIGEIFSQKSMFEGRKDSLLSSENSVEKSNECSFIFISVFHERETLPK